METITDDRELTRAGFDWRERDGVRAITCRALAQENFVNAFSTRLGGVSPMPHDSLNLAGFDDDAASNIHENRRRFLRLFEDLQPAAAGASPEWSLSACWQVHGADVRIVRDAADARSDQERCDALATGASGVLLAVKSADCVPILLGDARTGACASVHAGWRGTVARILEPTLERLRAEYGTRAEDILAAIGPAARACCYEVGAEVMEAFQSTFKDTDELFIPTRDGHARVDLQRANRNQLTDMGVPDERIYTLPLCTMCRTDLFFSYRREKKLYGRTGRLLSVIGRGK